MSTGAPPAGDGRMRVVVTDAEFPDLELEQRIVEDAGFEFAVAQCRTPQQVIDACRDATALIVQYAPVTAEVFAALDRLRIVSRYGVGVDSVDVQAASASGVWVANVPDYGTEEVAAHAVGLLLGLVRHLSFHDRAVRTGTWDFSDTGPHHRLSTMTFGLVGLGRIGRTVAERAGPWFGRVVAYDPFLPDEAWPAGVDRAELDEVFAVSHAVSLHLPLTDETRGLVDHLRLELVSDRGLYLVNTARGGLVDLGAGGPGI
jgi:D-3-phosphoglycerate dehydrogenase / 2-oxoglutarate reductase